VFNTNKKDYADVRRERNKCICMSHLNSAGQNSKLNLRKCGRVKTLGNTVKMLIAKPNKYGEYLLPFIEAVTCLPVFCMET
jgi:hypothetical protein